MRPIQEQVIDILKNLLAFYHCVTVSQREEWRRRGVRQRSRFALVRGRCQCQQDMLMQGTTHAMYENARDRPCMEIKVILCNNTVTNLLYAMAMWVQHHTLLLVMEIPIRVHLVMHTPRRMCTCFQTCYSFLSYNLLYTIPLCAYCITWSTSRRTCVTAFQVTLSSPRPPRSQILPTPRTRPQI